MIKISYEQRLVIFIDILGFKNLITQSKEDETVLKNILRALQTFNEFRDFNTDLKEFSEEFSDSTIIDDSREITNFSDSIVISFKIEGIKTLEFVINRLLNIMVDLLEYNVILRGGIAIGDMIHTEDIVFGPAFIDAYSLENEVASFPRIIFSKEIVKKYNIYSLGGIKEDDDEYYYLDYFNLYDFNYFGGDPSSDIIKHFNPLRIITSEVSSLFDENDFKKILETYTILKNKWNNGEIQTPICEIFCESCNGCGITRSKLQYSIENKKIIKNHRTTGEFNDFDYIKKEKNGN
jgi:hypothetical protein